MSLICGMGKAAMTTITLQNLRVCAPTTTAAEA
jgi:hypothetical protein